MKLEILIDESVEDLHIQVTCKQLTSDIERIIASLLVLNRQLTAKKSGEIYFLDITQIIYIENVDRKSFIYTADDIFECDLRLYELEQQLEEFGFFRVSKFFLIYLPTFSPNALFAGTSPLSPVCGLINDFIFRNDGIF